MTQLLNASSWSVVEWLVWLCFDTPNLAVLAWKTWESTNFRKAVVKKGQIIWMISMPYVLPGPYQRPYLGMLRRYPWSHGAPQHHCVNGIPTLNSRLKQWCNPWVPGVSLGWATVLLSSSRNDKKCSTSSVFFVYHLRAMPQGVSRYHVYIICT